MTIIKSTSYEYGNEYQINQANKYRNRNNNHWKLRIELAEGLVDKFVLPRFGCAQKDLNVVDVGCSIGTFAIEFAKKGYFSYGIDFDRSALEIAHQLAIEENVSPEFICGDVSDWNNTGHSIDVAICFDIFEHLHDDELGALLASIKKQLSEKGALVFHTYPTQYDYIFFTRYRYMLIPFSRLLSSKIFDVIVKVYSLVIDIGLQLKKGATYREHIKSRSHCNPTTIDRLTDILKRAGYEIEFIESSNIYDFHDSI